MLEKTSSPLHWCVFFSHKKLVYYAFFSEVIETAWVSILLPYSPWTILSSLLATFEGIWKQQRQGATSPKYSSGMERNLKIATHFGEQSLSLVQDELVHPNDSA